MKQTAGTSLLRDQFELSFLMLLFLVSCVCLSVYQHRPPDALPATAPATTFSGIRAHKHVEAFAQRPHPAGTPANAEVRDYILRQLAAMGTPGEVQRVMVHWRAGHAATVENVVARLRGTGNTGAVALVAHYDSVAFGPGAGDDGAGVAALLESLRALKAGPPLKNDIIFLFTDGEEGRMYGGTGLRGARAFVRHHPWIDDIAVVLNFDCRGNSGPSYMYETSPENGWLVEQLARAECAPVASSAMFDIFHSMPVDSDFTPFKKAGLAGMNFGFINGLTKYHTSLDTPENLDPDSLQHHGTYALGLARHLGNLPLDAVRKPDAVYFNAFGYTMARYPMAWVLPLNVLMALLALAVLGLGLARKRLTVTGTILGFVTFLLLDAFLTGITALVVYVGYQARGLYIIYDSASLTLACVAMAIGAVAFYVGRLSKRIRTYDLAAGAIVLWILLALAVGWISPGASYLFTWPAFFSLLGLAGIILPRYHQKRFPVGLVFLLAITSVPLLILMSGILYGFYTGLTVVFAPVVVFFLALALGLLIPHLKVITQSNGWLLPAISWAAAAVFLVLGAIGGGFDAQHPKLNCLTYGYNAANGQAFWLSSDAETDAWTRTFFPPGTQKQPVTEFFPNVAKRYLKSPAPSAPLAPPEVTLAGETMQGDVRRLRLKITSPRHAPVMQLYALSDTPVLATAVDGVPFEPVEGRWFLCYSIFPREGIELALDLKSSAPFKLAAVDHSFALPKIPGYAIPPRPDYMIVKPNTVDLNREPLKSDETIVLGTYTF